MGLFGGFFDFIGDALGGIGEFFDDLSDDIGDFLEGFANPITLVATIAKVAAAVTGQVWLVPIISGVETAIKGGDFGDIITSVAISTATTLASAGLSSIPGLEEVAGSGAIDIGGEAVGAASPSFFEVALDRGLTTALTETLAYEGLAPITAKILANTLVGATKGAVSSTVFGMDPVQGALSGGAYGAVSTGVASVLEESGLYDIDTELSDVANYAKNLGLDVVSSTLVSGLSSLAATGSVEFDPATITSGVILGKTINNIIGKEVLDLKDPASIADPAARRAQEVANETKVRLITEFISATTKGAINGLPPETVGAQALSSYGNFLIYGGGGNVLAEEINDLINSALEDSVLGGVLDDYFGTAAEYKQQLLLAQQNAFTADIIQGELVAARQAKLDYNAALTAYLNAATPAEAAAALAVLNSARETIIALNPEGDYIDFADFDTVDPRDLAALRTFIDQDDTYLQLNLELDQYVSNLNTLRDIETTQAANSQEEFVGYSVDVYGYDGGEGDGYGYYGTEIVQSLGGLPTTPVRTIAGDGEGEYFVYSTYYDVRGATPAYGLVGNSLYNELEPQRLELEATNTLLLSGIGDALNAVDAGNRSYLQAEIDSHYHTVTRTETVMVDPGPEGDPYPQRKTFTETVLNSGAAASAAAAKQALADYKTAVAAGGTDALNIILSTGNTALEAGSTDLGYTDNFTIGFSNYIYGLKTSFDEASAALVSLQAPLLEAQGAVFNSVPGFEDYYETTFVPTVTRALALSASPNFDPDFYRQSIGNAAFDYGSGTWGYNITTDEAYTHYLETGLAAGLFTSRSDRDTTLRTAQTQVYNEVIDRLNADYNFSEQILSPGMRESIMSVVNSVVNENTIRVGGNVVSGVVRAVYDGQNPPNAPFVNVLDAVNNPEYGMLGYLAKESAGIVIRNVAVNATLDTPYVRDLLQISSTEPNRVLTQQEKDLFLANLEANPQRVSTLLSTAANYYTPNDTTTYADGVSLVHVLTGRAQLVTLANGNKQWQLRQSQEYYDPVRGRISIAVDPSLGAGVDYFTQTTFYDLNGNEVTVTEAPDLENPGMLTYKFTTTSPETPDGTATPTTTEVVVDGDVVNTYKTLYAELSQIATQDENGQWILNEGSLILPSVFGSKVAEFEASASSLPDSVLGQILGDGPVTFQTIKNSDAPSTALDSLSVIADTLNQISASISEGLALAAIFPYAVLQTYDPESIESIRQTDQAVIDAVSNLIGVDIGAQVDAFGDGIVSTMLSSLNAISDAAKATGDPNIAYAASLIIRAGGESLYNYAGAAHAVNTVGADTALGRFATEVLAIGGALTPSDRTQRIEAMQDALGQSIDPTLPWYERAAATIGNVVEAGYAHPVEFFGEIVVKEGIQELGPLLIGSAAKFITKAMSYAQRLAAMRKVGDDAAAAIVNRMGNTAALTAVAVSNIAESFGGSANEAYERASNTYLKINPGASADEVHAYALDVARNTGLVSAYATLASMGVGGLALGKAVFGDKSVSGTVGNYITSVALGAATEGVEEGITEAYLSGTLSLIDPSIDVASNVAGATFLGAVVGGSISGSAIGISASGKILKSTGNAIVDALIRTNPDVHDMYSSAVDSGTPDETTITEVLSGAGLTGAALTAAVLSTIYTADPNLTSTSEAIYAFAEAGYSANDVAETDPGLIDSLVGQPPALVADVVVTYAENHPLPETPVDETPVDETPVDETPVDETPVDETPVDETPVDETTVDETTVDETTVDETAVRQAIDDNLGSLINDTLGYSDLPVDRLTAAERAEIVDVLYALDSQGASITDEERASLGNALDGYVSSIMGRITTEDTRTGVLDNLSAVAPGSADIASALRAAVAQYAADTGADASVVYSTLGIAEDTDENLFDYFQSQLSLELLNSVGTAINTVGDTVDPTDDAASNNLTIDAVRTAIADTLDTLGVGSFLTSEDVRNILNIPNDENGEPQDIATYLTDTVTTIKDNFLESVAGYLPADFSSWTTGDIAAAVTTAIEDAGTLAGIDATAARGLLGIAEDEDLTTVLSGYLATLRTDIVDGIAAKLPTVLTTADLETALTSVLTDLDISGAVQTLLGIDDDTNLVSYMRNTLAADIVSNITLPESLNTDAVRTLLGIPEGQTLLEGAQDIVNTLRTDLASDISEGLTGVGSQLTALTDLIEQYRAAGATADAATNAAIADLAATLGTTEETLLAELGTTRDALASQISDVGGQVTDLSDQVQLIADYIGKPAAQVTQTDIDFVVDVIAGNAVANEQQVLDYDTNADGVVDQTDLDTLTSMQTGLAFDIPDPSRFAGTGIYGLFNELALQQQQIAAAQLAQQNKLAQQQLLTTLLTQPTGGGAVGTSGAAAQAPSPVNLNYVYDWSSIFATPQQERLFPSPYSGAGGGLRDLVYGTPRPQPQAQTINPSARGLFGASGGYVSGGQIDSDTDRLLRILGDT